MVSEERNPTDFDAIARKALDEGEQLLWFLPTHDVEGLNTAFEECIRLIARYSEGTMEAAFRDEAGRLYVRAVPAKR